MPSLPGAVPTLQWHGYATVQAPSGHQAWVQPCPSILQCFHDSSQDIEDRHNKKINELAASIASLKGCAANWCSDTTSGYAAHLQARMSHLLYWPASEGRICAVSKVNIPPPSEILYEDRTEHHRDEFPDRDFESDPVTSNPNYWNYGMRWDDDEKTIRFKGKIVCPTSLFEDVVVAIHSYGHPRVEKTVELFDRTFSCLAYDLPRDRSNLSPDIAKILGRCNECQTTKARRGTQPDTCEFAPVPQYPFTSLAIDVCKLPECLQKATGKKWTISWSLSAVKPRMYWPSLVKKRDWTVRVLLCCFWIDGSICLGCQKSSFVTMRPLSTLNFCGICFP